MTTGVQRNYKNGLFLMIFGNKQALLRLYNTMRGSNYTNPDDLIINTIEGVLYLGMKNDISFIINNELNLYEAQSTWNPNMPLRGLFYFARVYEGYVAEYGLNIYSKSLIKLPTPNNVVFYNGTEDAGDSRVLRLSDSFIRKDGEESCLECTATMININFGHNKHMMDSCRELYEYAFLVEEIRKGVRMGLRLADSVDRAVEVCIKEEVLKSFLLRHRAEVKSVILEEFDLNKDIELEKKESYQEGKSIGQRMFAELTQKLLADSRIDDLKRATEDDEFCILLYEEYDIK